MVKRLKIKLLILDVDGTLTDGSIYIGERGEVFKRFYCRDGLALLFLHKVEIIPVIITHENLKSCKIGHLNLELKRFIKIRKIRRRYYSYFAKNMKFLQKKLPILGTILTI